MNDIQQSAKNLDDAYYNFEIEKPLPSSSPFYITRQDKTVSKLKRNLLRMGSSTVPRYFFSGHTGCGKSTELLQLLADKEIAAKYWVLRFSIYEQFPSTTIDYKDLLFFLAVQLFNNYQEQGSGKIKKASQLLKEIEQWQGELIKEVLIQQKDRTGVDVEVKLKAVFAELAGKFSVEPHTRETVRQTINLNIRGLIDLINTLGSTIQVNEKKPPLVLIDDLDKLSLTSSRELFLEEGRTLLQINLPIVYTVGSALFYDPAFPATIIKNIFLPNIKLHEKTDRQQKVAEGYLLLKNFVHARMEPSLISEDALEMAITMSGGVFRELVRIMQQSIDYALAEDRQQVEIQDIAQVITDIRNTYWRILTQEQVDILVQVRNGLTRHDPAKMAELLKMLAVLEYNGDGTWYDIHPVLHELLDEFAREKRENGANDSSH